MVLLLISLSPASATAGNMQIPKQMSSPADPTKPSFLDRPAEIRNAIYEILFKRDESILLHNAQAYHAMPPKESPNAENANYYLAALKFFDEEYEREISQDRAFVHGVELVTPFLLTCRQVYSEAIGYLYGQNTFVFSRPLYRHDETDEENLCRYDIYAYLPLVYAAQWLNSLGSQLCLLTRVHIDANAFCPDHCDKSNEVLPMLPLLRLLWKHPKLAWVVTFSQREPTSDEQAYASSISHPSGDFSVDRSEKLHKILTALNVEDALQIKGYAHSDRLVTHVDVYSCLTAGRVQFVGGRYGIHASGSDFEISDEGALTWIEGYRPPLHIYSFGSTTLRRIAELSLYSADEISFNLDTRTFYGMSLAFNQVSKFTRSLLPSVPRHTNVTLKMTTAQVETDFDDFGTLNDLVHQPRTKPHWWQDPSNVFRNIITDRLNSHLSTTIVLNFDIATSTSLDEVRINVKSLLPIVTMPTFPSQARIRFALNCPWGDQVHQEEAIVVLEDLQKRLFLLLSDLLKQWPTNVPTTRRKQFPDIWINGRGAIISASYPASATSSAYSVAYRHDRLSRKETQYRGYKMAVMDEPDSFVHWADIYGPLSGGEVVTCWSKICHLHWADVGHKRIPIVVSSQSVTSLLQY
jgi:hypothetical protein